jgi:hypothetical protein
LPEGLIPVARLAAAPAARPASALSSPIEDLRSAARSGTVASQVAPAAALPVTEQAAARPVLPDPLTPARAHLRERHAAPGASPAPAVMTPDPRPTIEVRIGVVEISAPPSGPPASPAAAPRPRGMSLDDYLAGSSRR